MVVPWVEGEVGGQAMSPTLMATTVLLNSLLLTQMATGASKASEYSSK